MCPQILVLLVPLCGFFAEPGLDRGVYSCRLPARSGYNHNSVGYFV